MQKVQACCKEDRVKNDYNIYFPQFLSIYN